MNPDAVELLKKERVCLLAVPMGDGAPHAAVVHYSAQAEPVKIFVQTYPTVKTKAIQDAGGSAKAAVVVGMDEKTFITLQMRGMVRIVTNQAELEAIYKIHYAKHPGAQKYQDANTIFLEFTPTWWRYSDFKTDPETIVESK
jgi:general stress protein 26